MQGIHSLAHTGPNVRASLRPYLGGHRARSFIQLHAIVVTRLPSQHPFQPQPLYSRPILHICSFWPRSAGLSLTVVIWGKCPLSQDRATRDGPFLLLWLSGAATAASLRGRRWPEDEAEATSSRIWGSRKESMTLTFKSLLHLDFPGSQ